MGIKDIESLIAISQEQIAYFKSKIADCEYWHLAESEVNEWKLKLFNEQQRLASLERRLEMAFN